MSKLVELKRNLRPGHVYRRADLSRLSNAVDRHVAALVNDGTLQKLHGGLYYFPTESVFGKTPPDEYLLVQTFLKDDHFLLTSPNDYNSLGVGTTQLYNKRVVYNHKRHGVFKLGGKTFTFVSRHRFPKKATPEFLLVDLLNNLDSLAEDPDFILKNVSTKLKTMDLKKVKKNLSEYGNLRAKSRLQTLIKLMEGKHDARLSA
jgi:hypothetical protein